MTSDTIEFKCQERTVKSTNRHLLLDWNENNTCVCSGDRRGHKTVCFHRSIHTKPSRLLFYLATFSFSVFPFIVAVTACCLLLCVDQRGGFSLRWADTMVALTQVIWCVQPGGCILVALFSCFSQTSIGNLEGFQVNSCTGVGTKKRQAGSVTQVWYSSPPPQPPHPRNKTRHGYSLWLTASPQSCDRDGFIRVSVWLYINERMLCLFSFYHQ